MKHLPPAGSGVVPTIRIAPLGPDVLVEPVKPRIRVLRHEPSRFGTGAMEPIYVYDFGEPSNHRNVEAWRKIHPDVGAMPINNRVVKR